MGHLSAHIASQPATDVLRTSERSNLRGSRNHLSFSSRTSQYFHKLYTSGVIAGYWSLQGLEGHAAGGHVTRGRALTCMSISDGHKPVHNQMRVLSAGVGVRMLRDLDLGSRIQPSLTRRDSSSTAIQTQSTLHSSVHECVPCRGFRVLSLQGFHDSNWSFFEGSMLFISLPTCSKHLKFGCGAFRVRDFRLGLNRQRFYGLGRLRLR